MKKSREKIWGGASVLPQPTHISGLKLIYCLESLKKIKGMVLDVGCGAGGFAKGIKMARPDLEVWGIDIDKKAINQAKKEAGGVEFKSGDGQNLAFEVQSFDGVVMVDALEHLIKPQKAISEIHRILKSGGILFLSVPLEGERHSLVNFLSKLGIRSKGKLTGHIQSFTRKKLFKLLKENGFEIKKIRYSVFFLGQLIDSLFYFLLEGLVRQKSPLAGYSSGLRNLGVEEWLVRKKTLGRKFLIFGKKIITSLVYFESRLFFWLPLGGEVAIEVRKRDEGGR